MNEQIAQLQDSDPEFALTLKRLRAASYGLAAAIVLAAGLGLWAVVVNSEQATQITKIQKTPCTLAPEGRACTRIKERIARHGDLRNPCIEHQRVTGAKGRNCRRFFIPQGTDRQVQIHPNLPNGLDEGATGGPAPTSIGEGDIGAGHGKGTSEGTEGGTKQPTKSPVPSPQAESETPSVDITPDTSPSTGVPTETTSPDQAEGGPVKSTLEQTGETVHSVVCPLTERLLQICP
jgi:hypothetical protein